MKFPRADVSNAAVEISDMRVELEADDDGSSTLRVHLTFGFAEIGLDERQIKVSAKEALLRLGCEGVEVNPASKFGELVRNNSTKSTYSREIVRKTQSSFSGGLSVEGAAAALAPSAAVSASLAAKGSRDIEEISKHVSSAELEQLRVEALGGDRWRIREIDEPRVLRGNYLKSEALCKLRSSGNANRQRLEVSVEIKQRDLHFDPKPDTLMSGLLGSTNREKLTKILLAKSLHKAMDAERDFNGILVASHGVCEASED